MKIDIYMPCPICYSEGYHTSHQYWRHAAPCGGVLTLDEYATVECKSCLKSGNLKNMTLKCEQDRHKFKVATTKEYASAISSSAQFANGGGISWLQNILHYIK